MNMLRFPGSSTMPPHDCSLSKARGIAATLSIIFQKRYEIFYHQKRYAKNPVIHIPFFRILYYFILLFITLLLFTKLCKFVSNKLNLRSDNYLNRSLSRFNNPCNSCRFNYLIIYSSYILIIKSQSANTVIDTCKILFSTASFEDFCSDGSIIITF